ncbi:unnamed protein product [Euphydryas editha]|uniref:Uncharacterized protein n=1 Tax=Euphydryas editha TaxID=104508 RepID=A0AAU9UWV6_EUPED|nr:unnamed protein product [Euphydryas editha]
MADMMLVMKQFSISHVSDFLFKKYSFLDFRILNRFDDRHLQVSDTQVRVHLPPPPAPPPSGAAPTAGATHRTAKIESVGCGAGSNGDESVKRRSGVRETDGDETHTGASVRVRAERDGRGREGRRCQLLSPGGQLPHYPLPPRARPRAAQHAVAPERFESLRGSRRLAATDRLRRPTPAPYRASCTGLAPDRAREYETVK